MPKRKGSDRVAIISAVKTYLGFFVLAMLVVEAVLRALAAQTQGQNQLVALYGMLFVIVVLIALVTFFAYRKPEALLRMTGRAYSRDGAVASLWESVASCINLNERKVRPATLS